MGRRGRRWGWGTRQVLCCSAVRPCTATSTTRRPATLLTFYLLRNLLADDNHHYRPAGCPGRWLARGRRPASLGEEARRRKKILCCLFALALWPHEQPEATRMIRRGSAAATGCSSPVVLVLYHYDCLVIPRPAASAAAAHLPTSGR